jgi:hypothetical protein
MITIPPVENKRVNKGNPIEMSLSNCQPIKKAARMTAISLKAKLE